MKKLLLAGFTLFAFSFTFAQIQGDGGIPKSYKLKNLANNSAVHFSEPDIDALRAEDAIIEETKSGPWRFGFNNETELTLQNSGNWITLPNGARIWRLKMECENALTVNLTLSKVKIPEGNELYFYNSDKSFILGKFTAYHLYEGNLGTELIPGNIVIAEYYVAPNNSNSDASLSIDRVTHGYRTANDFAEKAFGNSGNCNMNVNCPDGAPWADQKRGAVMLVSGSNGFCSGSLINNTQNDGKPYVLTANHCYSNPTNWIFRFHWEAAGCANPGASPTFMSLSGATLRSRRTPSDFCLVEITGGLIGGLIPPTFNPFFPGWNNGNVAPTSTVSIHHPSGDIKKIAFDDNPAVALQAMGSTEAASSWEVVWDRNTTTEGGSSGSPLFNQNGQIIGQLWGGGASCANLSSSDYYGRVHNSWEPTGSNSTNQLKFWLDPNLTGVNDISPYDPSNPPAPDNAGINSISSPSGTYCGSNSFTPTFKIRNYGSNNLVSATVTYDIDGGANQVYNWTGNLAPNASETITLAVQTVSNGAHNFTATSSLPNGTVDSGTTNDSATSLFSVNTAGEEITITINTDCYAEETSWVLNDENMLLVTSNPSNLPSLSVVEAKVCVVPGCYTFVINDVYGDGVQAPSCSTIGSYAITNSSDSVLAVIQNPSFGFSESNNFCFGSAALCAVPLSSTLIIAIASTGSNDGSINVSTSGGSGNGTYTYSWIGPGGYTNSSEDIAGLAPGLYTLTTTDECGNTQVLNDIQIVSTASINELDATDFMIFPNPSNGNFAVVFNKSIGEYKISMTDISGRVIFEENSNSLELQIELENVAKGNYFVNIASDNSTTIRKIQIQK